LKPVRPKTIVRTPIEQRKLFMPNLVSPVSDYMSSPVHSVRPDDDLKTALERMSGLRISSLAVVDPDGRPVGVISMTDLVRIGLRQAGSSAKAALLTVPQKNVERRMSTDVVTVEPGDSLASAADLMVGRRMHRVFVVDHEKLVGVLSTNDIMSSIRDKRLNAPISSWMSTPAFTIRSSEPISEATMRLEKARVSGLIVVEDEWPVGLFTQREALEARDASRDTAVEEVMTSSMLALDVSTPLHRAAAQAGALRVRRVIATNHRKIEGILTGIDFARAAAS
jgi:predicted transcriptional regulator